MPTIAYIKQKDEGRRYVLGIVEQGEQVRRVSICAATYQAAGCPVRGQVLSEQMLAHFDEEDEQLRALRHALYLLSFADNSECELRRKLRSKGYAAAAVQYAVQEVVRLGYVRERVQLHTLITTLANSRLYGPRRITAALSAKGYRASDIRAVMRALCEQGAIDFCENFRTLESKKGDGTVECRRKLQYTYGYQQEYV